MTGLDIEQFRPDDSGKYSPLLYAWLKSKRSCGRGFRQVFQTGSAENRCNFTDHWRMNEIVIGSGDAANGVGGNSLGAIIHGKRGVKSNSWFYGPGFNLREITDEFWSEYARIGRCVWDQSHGLWMIGDEHRYTESQDGKSRVCNWCGANFEGHEMSRVKTWTEWRRVADNP